MQKLNKKFNTITVSVILFSLLAMYGFVPMASAASLTDARDLISNSDVSATGVTHEVTFKTGLEVPEDGYMQVTFPAFFTGLVGDNITCSNGATSSPDALHARCVATAGSGGAIASGTQTITISGMNNPATSTHYTINVGTFTSGEVEIETAEVKVYIIDTVLVSATVPATLTFGVSGVNAGVEVNGVVTTGASTATATPFGTLDPTSSSTIAQQLMVTTNASDGYIVTVQQDGELESAAGAIINSFKDAAVGTGATTSTEVWDEPAGLLADPNTWGHMGLTSDDIDAYTQASVDYSGNKFSGLAGSDPLVVMSHDDPADGNVGPAGAGLNNVAYKIQISALQEAGDYTTTLTYICTPQF